MSIVACQTEPEIFVPADKETFDLTIVADETRTELNADGTAIQWSEGDQLSVIVNGNTYTTDALTGATTTAFFNVNGVATSDSGYTIQAVYPASANEGARGDNYPNIYKIETLAEQHPSVSSFDGDADMLIAKEVSTNEQPTELSMQFTRLVALGKMTLTDFTPDAAIKSVTFATDDAPLAGRSYINLSTAEVDTYGYTNMAEKSIVMSYEGTEVWTDGYTIYFTCFPAEITTGFSVVVETVNGTKYTRDVKFDGKKLSFTAGDMTRFKVNMESAVKEEAITDVYSLLTDITDLTVGDKIIIAAIDYDHDYDYALSTTQNKNNRGQVAINRSEDKKEITNLSADVQIMTVEAGLVDDTFAFNTGSGYLYAASSSSNYLRTETALSGNSSWTVEVTTRGEATIKAQGANNRNLMQYNDTSGLFSCYSSGQKGVSIYYINGVAPDYLNVSTSEISFAAEGGEATFTVETNVEGAVSVVSSNTQFVVAEENGVYTVSAAANETSEEITGTITISVGDLSKTIAVTQAAPIVVIEATVAEFLAAAVSETDVYQLTGTITQVTNDTYGNFYINDGTGKVYIYGLYSPEGVEKYWGASGAKIGDDITIQTVRSSYNGSPQGVNAIFVGLVSPGTLAFWTLGSDTVSFTADGGSKSVDVTIYNSTSEVSADCDSNQFAATYSNGVLAITALENTTTEALSGTITLTCGELTAQIAVTQAAKSATTSYSYTFTKTTFSANGTVALGGLSWTLAGDGGYWGYDATKGQQFGSGKNPYKSLTLSTSDYKGDVSKIVLDTSGASSTNATCTVTVGGTPIGSSIKLTSTATEYTFESTTPLTGEIVISYTQTSAKAIYIKSIAIN